MANGLHALRQYAFTVGVQRELALVVFDHQPQVGEDGQRVEQTVGSQADGFLVGIGAGERPVELSFAISKLEGVVALIAQLFQGDEFVLAQDEFAIQPLQPRPQRASRTGEKSLRKPVERSQR